MAFQLSFWILSGSMASISYRGITRRHRSQNSQRGSQYFHFTECHFVNYASNFVNDAGTKLVTDQQFEFDRVFPPYGIQKGNFIQSRWVLCGSVVMTVVTRELVLRSFPKAKKVFGSLFFIVCIKTPDGKLFQYNKRKFWTFYVKLKSSSIQSHFDFTNLFFMYLYFTEICSNLINEEN